MNNSNDTKNEDEIDNDYTTTTTTTKGTAILNRVKSNSRMKQHYLSRTSSKKNKNFRSFTSMDKVNS